jgi:hypothetical protein
VRRCQISIFFEGNMTNDVFTKELNAEAAPVPSAPGRVPQIYVHSHSTMFYWWPAWAFGFALALLNEGQERFHTISESQWAGSALGLSYVCLLLLLIVFTNVRLRGIYSVVTLLAIALIGVLLAWFGWWDDIARLIPYLSVRMNTGFYLVFSSALLILWLMMFFIFDRMTYWRIRPGQMTIEHLIGGGAESFDTNALRFQKLSSDFFRATLGFGAGDLQATGGGQPGAPLHMTNVLFAGRKVKAIERLISVKPDLVS